MRSRSKLPIVALIYDFDGTLADSTGNIPQNVREKIKYFIANGGIFTVCTGRTMQGFHRYAPDIINAPVLCSNGMMAYDYAKHKTVFADTMKEDAEKLIKAVLGKYPDMCIELYCDNFETFVINPDERTRNHLEGQNIAYSVIISLDEIDVSLVKLMIGVGEKSAEVQKLLAGIDLGKVRPIPSDGAFLEIVSTTSDKGKGLYRLADILSVPHNRVFAVGDGSNDVDMLTDAFLSFVPENAEEKAKKAGDVFVCSNDDGAVSEAIDIIEEFAAKGSIIALSDAGVGAAFCKAALYGASLNVFINTKSMANREYAEGLNKEAQEMMAVYGAKADAVFEGVNARLK